MLACQAPWDMLYFVIADKGKPGETRGRKAYRPTLPQNREGPRHPPLWGLGMGTTRLVNRE